MPASDGTKREDENGDDDDEDEDGLESKAEGVKEMELEKNSD